MSRIVRLGLAGVGGLAALIVVLTAGTLYVHPRAAGPWVEFSIGPASGDSASIGREAIRADGITVKGALAAAYDIPAVRIVGPSWLSHTRYSLTAVVRPEERESLRPRLRTELENRFHVETHLEPRLFDVFVLTAIAPRLDAAQGGPIATWIDPPHARLTSASSQRIAAAVEYVVGKPVIDETGLRGTYDLTLEWNDDRVESITAELRHRYGLALTSARRELDVLIIDRIYRDPALLLMAHTGRLSRHAPGKIRLGLAQALSTH